MTAQAITSLIARYVSCLERHDVVGAAASVSTPSAIFFGAYVNVLNTPDDVATMLDNYLSALSANGLDQIDVTVKQQSLSGQDQYTVWVDTTFSQSKGHQTARSLSRFFCKPDASGDYKINMFEVLEHDDALLPERTIWAGSSRDHAENLPKMSERRISPRKSSENARSRQDFAAFTAIEDPQLRDSWARIVTDQLKLGRDQPRQPNDLYGATIRVYVEDQSISLRSPVGLSAYLGGFHARLAMAGAQESTTDFETIATNQNQDALLHGKWIWTDEDGMKYHLADVSYIFENTGKSHKMSVVSLTNIDPVMRPSLNGNAAAPMTNNVSPRQLISARDNT